MTDKDRELLEMAHETTYSSSLDKYVREASDERVKRAITRIKDYLKMEGSLE